MKIKEFILKWKGKEIKMNQGRLANLAGRKLERNVETILNNLGIPSISYKEWLDNPESDSKYILLKNVPYRNIYGGQGRGEFVLLKVGDDLSNGIRIECRSQKVSGSVDEKLPYLFENALAFDQKEVILVIDGDGFKIGAKEWLKWRSMAVYHKEIIVTSLGEFEELIIERLNFADLEIDSKPYMVFMCKS